MTARLQKFLAAKLAGTEKGREILHGMLGDNGGKLIDMLSAFNLVVLKDKDKVEGLNEDLFKVTAKFVVHIQNNKIKLTDFSAIVGVTRTLMYNIIDSLEMTSVCYDCKALASAMGTIADHLSTVLKPHITGKSLERIKSLHDYWSSKNTLDTLANQEQKWKSELAGLLTTILEELEVTRDHEEKSTPKASKQEKKEEKEEKEEKKESKETKESKEKKEEKTEKK